MPLINLIQEQRLEARKNERKARLFFMTFAGSAIAAVGTLGFLMFQSEMAHSEESELQAHAQKMQPLVKRIDDNKAEFGELEPRLQTLENAQVITGRWGRILDHISKQTPPQTWLTAMRCAATDPSKPVTITFSGLSTKQLLVGEYILRLQNSQDLQNVGLRYTQEKTVVSGHDIEFEISADVNGSADQPVGDQIKKEGGA